MLNRLLKNEYFRAGLIAAALTAVAGLLQANVRGPLWLFAFAGMYLGAFLTVVLLIVSVFSVAKETRSSSQAIELKPEVLPGSASYYKKRFIWSFVISIPGFAMWITAALTTGNGQGGGEAFIVFIPLMMLSFVMIFAMLIYGVMYLYKRKKESDQTVL